MKKIEKNPLFNSFAMPKKGGGTEKTPPMNAMLQPAYKI
jgi:hypothetical protein